MGQLHSVTFDRWCAFFILLSSALLIIGGSNKVDRLLGMLLCWLAHSFWTRNEPIGGSIEGNE